MRKNSENTARLRFEAVSVPVGVGPDPGDAAAVPEPVQLAPAPVTVEPEPEDVGVLPPYEPGPTPPRSLTHQVDEEGNCWDDCPGCATPLFDALAAERFPELFEADLFVEELFREPEPWDLVERVPLPIEGLIDDLRQALPEQVVKETEQSVAASALMSALHRAAEREEVRDAGDDIRPAGDADVADPAGGSAVVGDEGSADPGGAGER